MQRDPFRHMRQQQEQMQRQQQQFQQQQQQQRQQQYQQEQMRRAAYWQMQQGGYPNARSEAGCVARMFQGVFVVVWLILCLGILAFFAWFASSILLN